MIIQETNTELDVYRWVILFVTTGVQAAIAFITQGVLTLIPFLANSFDLSKAQVGLIGGSINIGMTMTLILVGRLVDNWGEKPVLIGGAIYTGLAIMAVSFARSFPVLLGLLVVTGFGAASSTPAGSRAIMSWFPFRARGMALGIRQTGFPIGGLLAALILPHIATALTWRGAFVAMGILAIIGAIVCLVGYRDRRTIKAETGRKVHKMSIDKVLKNKNIFLISLSAITLAAAQFSFLTYMVIFFHDKIGLPVTIGSIFLAVAQFAGIIGRIFWGIVSDRVFGGKRKAALFAVGLVTAIVPVAMAFVGPQTKLWELGLVVIAFGFSAIGWNGVYVALLSEVAGKETSGTVVGWGLTVIQVGVFVFPPLFGLIVDLSGSYRMSWLALSGLICLGLIILTRVSEAPESQRMHTNHLS